MKASEKIKSFFAKIGHGVRSIFKKREKPSLSPTQSHLPEHGPVDENGREILMSLKNVDITFGKGDRAVKRSLLWANPVRARLQSDAR